MLLKYKSTEGFGLFLMIISLLMRYLLKKWYLSSEAYFIEWRTTFRTTDLLHSITFFSLQVFCPATWVLPRCCEAKHYFIHTLMTMHLIYLSAFPYAAVKKELPEFAYSVFFISFFFFSLLMVCLSMITAPNPPGFTTFFYKVAHFYFSQTFWLLQFWNALYLKYLQEI